MYRVSVLLVLLWMVVQKSRATHLVNTEAATCSKLVRDAERYFYTNHIHITCNDMLLMKHGGSIYYKCDVIREYLLQHYALHCIKYCKTVRVNVHGIHDAHKRDASVPCAETAITCDTSARYRSYNGTCNNLLHPSWGIAGGLQNRIVPNAYDDGLGSSRTLSCTGGKLPGAREVSLLIHRAKKPAQKYERYLSYMMMQFGQFLAHDFVLTEMFTRDDLDPLLCCTEDAGNSGCDPIQIPTNDPYFPPGGCMNFARSLSRKDCHSISQQVNTQTSYLDLSMIYGVSEEEAASLRSFTGGRLLSTLNKLPPDYDDSSCELDQPFSEQSMYCTKTGDPRVNEQPGLAAIHTIFMREHNSIADGLAAVNPHWDDEMVFQEARRILIAVWQNIVYREYLPLVLGTKTMRRYGLNIEKCGYKDTYRTDVDATIINGVGTSVFRFGHSLIRPDISMVDTRYKDMMYPQNLSSHFFKVNLYHAHADSGYQHILRWTLQSRCPFMDNRLEVSVNDELYKDNLNESFDLAALNIHRSRDHGNPGYNAYRAFCGLCTAKHFGTGKGGLVDIHPDIARKMETLYSCPDDIDLFTGILAERRTSGSLLGPLGQCLLGTQFQRFKDGDRFFFEREEAGFTKVQLHSIRRYRLSSILCEQTSSYRMQKNVFIRPLLGRLSLVDCIQLPRLNLSLWREPT